MGNVERGIGFLARLNISENYLLIGFLLAIPSQTVLVSGILDHIPEFKTQTNDRRLSRSSRLVRHLMAMHIDSQSEAKGRALTDMQRFESFKLELFQTESGW